MKRVHVLHATLYLKMGGLETIIMNLARKMDYSRYKLSILCFSSYDESYKMELKKRGVSFYNIKRNGKFDAFFFLKIISLLKKEKIDIVHAHSGCFFNTAVCSKLAGIKTFVYTEHGLPLDNDGIPMNSRLKARVEDKIAAWISNRLFAVSTEIKEDMYNRFPRCINKIRMITNGVDTNLFKPMDDADFKKLIKSKLNIPVGRKLIGSVGRLVVIKNYESLIIAFSILVKKHIENIHLILIGDGEERDRLETIVKERDLGSFVTFAGVQYNIYNILPTFDVFVLPSWTEGTSISLLEAQSCGIPAVVTNVGGNPVIVENGVSGYMFEPDDSLGLSEKLAEMINNDDMRTKMGSAARKGIEEGFSVQKMISDYETTYNELFSLSEKQR